MNKYIKLSFTLALLFLFQPCTLIAQNKERIVKQTLSADWKIRAGEGVDSLWMNKDYDDSHWQEIASTQTLSELDFKTENRFAWYRKSITFSDSLKTAIQQSGAIVLHLGKFASCEELYVNGRMVGKTGEFPPNFTGYTAHERNYLVMVDDLNLDGENLFAIKFNEGWGKGGFLSKSCVELTSASTNDKLALVTEVSSVNNIFLGDANMQLTVNLDNKNAWMVNSSILVTLTSDDGRFITQNSMSLAVAGKTYFTKAFTAPVVEPGFYKYKVEVKREGELITSKELTVGYEPEKINSPVDSKTDLRTFWDANLAELAKIDPDYKLIHQADKSNADYDLYLVEMKSFENELIRGYYAKPKREGKHPIIIEYMGYGSEPYTPNMTWDGYAYFVLSIRGQALNKPSNRFGTWITYGVESKENYYYRGAYLDVVRAIDFVCSRPEIDDSRIAARGGSQGGALTFVAAALDSRIKVVAPSIPFLSDFKDYFKVGQWPKSDFDVYVKNNPEAKWDAIYDVLSYFDIKNLGPWIKCPLIMGIGVQDAVCPPHINFAAYNQVQSEKKWIAFPHHGHSVGKEFYDRMKVIFNEKLGVAPSN